MTSPAFRPACSPGPPGKRPATTTCSFIAYEKMPSQARPGRPPGWLCARKRSVAETRIHRGGHDGPFEDVLPVGVERPDVADRAVGDARRTFTDARHDERVLAEREIRQAPERQRRQAVVRQPDKCEPRGEVVV